MLALLAAAAALLPELSVAATNRNPAEPAWHVFRAKLIGGLKLTSDGTEDGAPESRQEAQQAAGPLRQGSTPAQDAQECGFLLLPEKVELAPGPPLLLERSGVWRNLDTATMLTWSQPLLRWSPDNVYYFIGPQAFLKVEQQGPDPEHPGTESVALRDCEEQLMYTLRVNQEDKNNYQIFNRNEELVAESHLSRENAYYGNQLEFLDSFGQPIAIANCPVIPGPGELHLAASAAGGAAREGFAGIAPWQVLFMDAYTSNSSLLIAQNRWVITAVVQDLALRDAPAPDLHNWFLAMVSIPSAILLALLLTAMNAVYDIVYPPPKRSAEVTNPFLKDFRAYGALAPRDAPAPPSAGAGSPIGSSPARSSFAAGN